MSGQRSQWSVFRLWALGSVRRLQRAQTHLKCWVNIHGGCCMSTKVIVKKVKVRSQKVSIKQRSQACRATHFWVVLNAAIDGDIIWPYDVIQPDWTEGRSRWGQRRSNFHIKIFTLFRIPLGFQICHLFSSTMCRTPKKSQVKMTSIFAIYYK